MKKLGTGRYTLIPILPADFSFEIIEGTVQSLIPDFIIYDSLLRSPESSSEYCLAPKVEGSIVTTQPTAISAKNLPVD
jgi:hypothetical protein